MVYILTGEDWQPRSENNMSRDMGVKVGYVWKRNPVGLNSRIYIREVGDSEARNIRRKPGQEFGDLVKVI